jgi:hypothetical protein
MGITMAQGGVPGVKERGAYRLALAYRVPAGDSVVTQGQARKARTAHVTDAQRHLWAHSDVTL